MDVIITGGNSKHFEFLELFISSLRTNGKFTGVIALCDNFIEGTWDKPGKFRDGISFTDTQLEFFRNYQVTVYSLSDLLRKNNIDRNQIDEIPSQTQRYPFKFVYTTLISKEYLDADTISYFDADIYFQKPVYPIFRKFSNNSIAIVKEQLRIKESGFLSRWITFSDFSKVSDQSAYLETMMNAEDFCSGFFGSMASEFHRFTLLCLLLTSNKFVNFYSDQPLINIMKSFFFFPFKELEESDVLHLGEIPKEKLSLRQSRVVFNSAESIAVHFNGDTKDLFQAIKNGALLPPSYHLSFIGRIKKYLKNSLRKLIKITR